MPKNNISSIKLLILILVLLLTGTSFNQNIYLFDYPIYYNTAAGSIESAVEDVNGDGYVDLIVLNYMGSNVSILLNNGNGTFQNHNTYSVMPAPRGLKVADYNNDSFPDIVATCSGTNVIAYLQNNGDGTFAASINSPTQQGPHWIDAYDFNGDSYLDVALVNGGSKTVQVLLNNHDGTFTPSFSAATGDGPACITIGDLNEDTYPELVVTRSFVNYIFVNGLLTVFRNNGDGTFTKYIDDNFGSAISNICICDFNGDTYTILLQILFEATRIKCVSL